MSVDLVGSTSYKAAAGDRHSEDQPYPAWVTEIRQFYQKFPLILENQYQRQAGQIGNGVSAEGCPKLWKTIGDEILFCCRVQSLEHLSSCVSAFLKTLDAYGAILDKAGKHLDVKGAGWIAAFPAPNVTVHIAGRQSASAAHVPAADYVTETFEALADAHPSDFDFLGREIDSGFRVARNASADKFTASVELAYLLANACHHRLLSSKFIYHGRQVLKGVIRDRPYPILSLDTERDAIRIDIRDKERAISGYTEATPSGVRDFLRLFMEDSALEVPTLHRFGSTDVPPPPPKSYSDFKARWDVMVEGVKRQEASLQAGEANGGPSTVLDEVPSEIATAAEAMAQASDKAADANQ